jgi:hypothetical protein
MAGAFRPFTALRSLEISSGWIGLLPLRCKSSLEKVMEVLPALRRICPVQTSSPEALRPFVTTRKLRNLVTTLYAMALSLRFGLSLESQSPHVWIVRALP